MAYIIETIHSTQIVKLETGDVVTIPAENDETKKYVIVSFKDNSLKLQGGKTSMMYTARRISDGLIIEEPVYAFRISSEDK